MCNKMYENVKSLDYTKKFLQSDSDPATMEAVSYTHLDVYKRQVLIFIDLPQLQGAHV